MRQPITTVRSVLRISRLARRHRADVVVSWMSKGQLYGGPAAGLAGISATWYQLS